MPVFGTVEASAALRSCCGCRMLPGGRALPRRGRGGGNEAVRVVPRRAGLGASEARQVGTKRAGWFYRGGLLLMIDLSLARRHVANVTGKGVPSYLSVSNTIIIITYTDV